MRNLVLLALVLAAFPATAQMSSMPAEVRSRIAAIGPVWGPEVLKETISLYRPILKDAPRGGVKFSRDIAYGTHPQQMLDMAQPEPALQGLPVLIFIPGGGFATSNRNVEGLCCTNLLAFFAQRGVLAIAASYRTAPANQWPAGSQDVAAVVAWAKRHAAQYGGDPKRVFVFGNSAGAFNTAGYVFDPAARPDVAGAILMSGPHYRIVKSGLSPRDTAYLGEDERRYAERSPMSRVAQAPRIPVFLVYAEYDPPFLAAPSLELAQALCARDRQCPDVFMLRGHNHLSPSLSFNTPDVELGNRVLAFMERARRF